MYIEKLKKENSAFLINIFKLHQQRRILPDSFIVDVDQLLENATVILEEAKKEGVHLFFMLKQLGRNPFIAKELIKLGYEGAVVVDFKEAQTMMEHEIPIGNAKLVYSMLELNKLLTVSIKKP